MDLSLSPSETEFRDEVRTWLEENNPGPEPETDLDEVIAYRREWQAKLHEAGWAGISWPREYGGRGATLIEQAIFVGEAARAEAPSPANVLGLAMGGPVVIAHGSDEQKQRYLEPILTAEEIWCQGFSEPESGSDLASLKTKAVKDGDEWVVTGQKVWTTLAQFAKWCMLVARTDPDAPKHKGLTYFLMDMEQEGVEAKPLVQITGEGEFNEVFMEEARIPDENVVGGVGNGWSVAITTLMNERAGLAFGAIAQIANSLRRLGRLAAETRVNGHTAAEDPVIRQRLAQLQIEAETMRLNAYRGLTKTMQAGIPGPEGSLGKWQWADINQRISELALDIEGPYAPLERGSEHAVANGAWQYGFLRSRANSIEGGTTDILKNIIAERVLGLPRLRWGSLMYFDLTDEQQAIKSTAKELFAARCKSERIRELAASEHGFEQADWAEMAELGWPGLALPERWGGQGLGIVDLAVLFEEMGYALAPSPLLSNTVAGLALAANADDAQCERWLAPLAGGEKRGTLALFEAGTSAAIGEFGMEAVADGEGVVLDGEKVLVMDAASADFFLVATADGRRHVVERDADGVSVAPEKSIDLTRRLYSVTFDGVRVGPEATLAGGQEDYLPVLWRGCAAIAAESTGVAQRTMEMAVDYAKEREQFGRPIGAYQAVSHRCAQMLLETENARSAVYGAAWAADAEPDSLPLAASMAKAYASDAGWRVPDASIQVHGGIGFTWEHDLHFFLKRGKANAAMFGTASWHRERVADLVLADRVAVEV